MEKKYIDFCKALEKSKIIVSGSHKRPEVIEVLKKIAEAPEAEIKDSDPYIVMIHDEYTDWVETYVEK